MPVFSSKCRYLPVNATGMENTHICRHFANLAENPICHLLKIWVANSCYLGICYESNFLEEQALFHWNYCSTCMTKHNSIWSKAGLEKLTNANPSSRFTNNRQFPWASRKLPIGRFRAHGNCRSAVSVTIGRFLIYGKECILTLNSIIFPSYTLFLVIYGFKKTVSNISDIRR